MLISMLFICMIIWFSATHLPYVVWTELGRIIGKNTITDVVHNIGPRARENLKKHYIKAGINYPGDQVAFLIFDKEKLAEIWAKSKDRWHLVNTYPTKEGTTWIGEGAYKIIGLNSNIFYPISIKFQSEYYSDRCFDIFLDKKLNLSNNAVMLGEDVFSKGCLAIDD